MPFQTQKGDSHFSFELKKAYDEAVGKLYRGGQVAFFGGNGSRLFFHPSVTFTEGLFSYTLPLMVRWIDIGGWGSLRCEKRHSLNVENFSEHVGNFVIFCPYPVSAEDRISQGLKWSEKTYGHMYT